MKIKIRMFLSITMVFVLTAASAVAADQNIFISKKLKGSNHSPTLAVNTKTGDVLVVWCQQAVGNNNDVKIYAMLCQRKGSSYRARKPWLVSKGTESYASAFAAYNPDKNNYLVAWHQFSGLRTVSTRIVKAKGKPKGKIYTPVSSNRQEGWPVLQYTGDSKVGPYLLVFSAFPDGAVAVPLDAKGKAAGAEVNIAQGYKNKSGGRGAVFVEDIAAAGNGIFLVSAHKREAPGNPVSQESFLFQLNPAGKLVKTTQLDGNASFGGRVEALTSKLYIASWLKYDTKFNRYYDQRIGTGLKKNGNKFPALNKSISTQGLDIVKLAKDPGLYQAIFSFDGNLMGQYINAKGQLAGSPKTLVPKIYSTLIRLGAIPGTNNVFMVWQEGASVVQTVHAKVFTAK